MQDDRNHDFSPVSFHQNQDFVLSRSLCKGEYAGGRWALFITLPAAICGESDQPDWLPRRFSPSVSAFEPTNTETRYPRSFPSMENAKISSASVDRFFEIDSTRNRETLQIEMNIQDFFLLHFSKIAATCFPRLITLLAKFLVPFM